nr:hypothetical protein [Salinispora cortesiana]
MTTDLNTLLTAPYVKIDDWLGRRRKPGRPPRLSDADLRTLAVAQALLGMRSEARWLRFVPGVTARVAQRLLAMTAAIWHNRATSQPVTRSLIAYNH